MASKADQTALPMKNAATDTHRPVQTFRLGRIKATVWKNPVDKKTFYNVTFVRTYLDEAKKFHDSDSFGRDDLLLVAKLADRAHSFIFAQLAKKKTEEQSE